MEALLVDAGDLLFIAPRGDFLGKFFRQERAQLAAHGVLALYAEELLHARVPGLDHAAKIDGQHADVQRFDDVFAEILEPRNLQSLLFERRIELGVVQGHSDVAGDGVHQLDVIAGQEITIDGLAEAQNGDGVLANAARHEVIQIQLLEGLADGIGNVSRRAGRLKEERPPGELGPGRLEEAEIHGLGKAHAHGTSEAHVSRLYGIFHEDREAVDQQGLREAVHDGTEHGIKAHFVGERAAELETVAVEKAVQARLNPFAEGLKKERGDDDGDHASDRPGGLRVEDTGDERDQSEINGGHGGGSSGVSQAALEDDVHVHQAIANDGIAETQRDEHQAENGGAHPGARRGVHEIRHDVERREGDAAGERPARQPLQLLTENTRRRFAEALVEHKPRSQEIDAEIAQLDFIEQNARAEPGHIAQHIEGGGYVKDQQRGARAINER